MNKLVLLIIFSLLFVLIFVAWQEDYIVKEPVNSFIEQERARTVFYHNYHGILTSYENSKGEWVFERLGIEIRIETKAARKAFLNYEQSI